MVSQSHLMSRCSLPSTHESACNRQYENMISQVASARTDEVNTMPSIPRLEVGECVLVTPTGNSDSVRFVTCVRAGEARNPSEAICSAS